MAPARPAQQEVAERALAKSAENTIEQREVRPTRASRNGKQQDQADNGLVAPGANVLISEQRNRPARAQPQHHDPEAQVRFLQSTPDPLFLRAGKKIARLSTGDWKVKINRVIHSSAAAVADAE